MGSLNSFKEVLNRLRMSGNGYSMAIVLDHRSTATSLTGNFLAYAKGAPEKIGDRPSQTYSPPPGKK